MSAVPSVPAPIEVLLLAAGHSRRMGTVDKLLLPVGQPDGTSQPLVRHSACLYLGLGLPLTVVTAPGNHAVAQALAGLPLIRISNHNPQAEQADSLRTGLGAARLSAPGLLIALADQPLLTATDITVLVTWFSQHPDKICIPRHDSQRGNPVILPSALARQLRDDPLAPTPRAHMDRHPEQIAWFEAESPHFTADIDTPRDAARLLAFPTPVSSL